jgi:predicted transcriptional regulator
MSKKKEMKNQILLELYRQYRHRRASVLKIELAAALLTFIENIESVLTELENEGFIRFGDMDSIYITEKGREVVKCLLEKERINRRLRELGWYDLGE